MKNIEEVLEEFDKKYKDFNSPSGLNQKDFPAFIAMVNDIRDNFLKQALLKVLMSPNESLVVEFKNEKEAALKMRDQEWLKRIEEGEEKIKHLDDRTNHFSSYSHNYTVSIEEVLEILNKIKEIKV